MEQPGVIVGCDRNQEWLLSWWWDHYSRHNHYPVVFMDFGLSDHARAWCETKGTCLTVPSVELKEVSVEHRELWTARWGDFWPMRPAWFKKPLGLSLSPFPFSCWLDLDCEVRGNLEPLFNQLALGFDLALARDFMSGRSDMRQNMIAPAKVLYNSGVIVYRPNAPFFTRFVSMAIKKNHLFPGDQDILSYLIHTESPNLLELSPIFNWAAQDRREDALILHHVGGLKVQIIKTLYPTLGLI